jgi:hypothetical protein
MGKGSLSVLERMGKRGPGFVTCATRYRRGGGGCKKKPGGPEVLEAGKEPERRG